MNFSLSNDGGKWPAGPGPHRALWRSLAERAEPVKFRAAKHNEFSPGIGDLNQFDRRNFLKLMGASLALASLPACTRQPIERIVPYVNQPEELVPGKPMYFATAMPLGGFATGLLVESHEGHPTKIEGNPAHPASLGATGIFHQAALLDLYDPDRSQTVLRNGQPSTWEEFVAAAHDVLEGQQAVNGRGLRILTETVTSPTLQWQMQELLRRFPEARWHQWDPVNHDAGYEGARTAFGDALEVRHHFDRAKIVLSLDADFLSLHPQSVRYARDFAAMRRARPAAADMSRVYVVESSPSVTGTNADHRLPLRAADIERFARQLAGQLGALPDPGPGATGEWAPWISAVAADLQAHRGESIVIVGDGQPAAVHALGHRLNGFLGNFGRTIGVAESAVANPGGQTASLRDLVVALNHGHVTALFILGGNPVFTAPGDLPLGANLARTRFTAHLGMDVNETSALCDWHVPQNHFLESWSDARAFDGTVSIVQPLILPLYGGKSVHDVIEALLSPPGRNDYDVVHDYWAAKNPGPDFENAWRRALHDGVMAGTVLPEKPILPGPISLPPMTIASEGLEVTFRPDPTLFDGRFANNGWLQELPKPVSQLVWDNAALVSPALAEKERLASGDWVELESNGRKARLPVWIMPGQAEQSVALHFGGGRTRVGRVGQGAGFNAYPLRTSGAAGGATGLTLRKLSGRYPLVTTQTQHVIDSEERQILREGTFDEFQKHPEFARDGTEAPGRDETLFEPDTYRYDGYRWGMAIDLSACIGCAACTIACQAENNIPVVGKTEVARGRIMHWIRVDNYFRGEPANPAFTHQPVPCMHCENAPCELVCPVGATVHDHEGLNLQVYQRCVGTRYCSNNCPYKVRRFNFFEYADYRTPSLKPMWNPNVTLRWRGVMEKCTYCVQRISAARTTAEEQGRKIAAGELQTACQQVCPAGAIVFGDLSDPHSEVSRLKSHPLNFLMLGELNTRPRTTYLAKLRNPHPELST